MNKCKYCGKWAHWFFHDVLTDYERVYYTMPDGSEDYILKTHYYHQHCVEKYGKRK